MEQEVRTMSRWPSLIYLIQRDERHQLEKAHDELITHCKKCGCAGCRVQLAAMGIIPVDEIEDLLAPLASEPRREHLN